LFFCAKAVLILDIFCDSFWPSLMVKIAGIRWFCKEKFGAHLKNRLKKAY
jgi:hypothetical protein